jgi:hypothetical protein
MPMPLAPLPRSFLMHDGLSIRTLVIDDLDMGEA